MWHCSVRHQSMWQALAPGVVVPCTPLCVCTPLCLSVFVPCLACQGSQQLALWQAPEARQEQAGSNAVESETAVQQLAVVSYNLYVTAGLERVQLPGAFLPVATSWGAAAPHSVPEPVRCNHPWLLATRKTVSLSKSLLRNPNPPHSSIRISPLRTSA